MLLLEDEPRLGQAVARALLGQGYGVRWAKGLEEAREAFLELEPDLMVLDVRLPEDRTGASASRGRRGRRATRGPSSSSPPGTLSRTASRAWTWAGTTTW